MVGVTEISASFMIVSGFISIGLLALALTAFRRRRDPAMGFLAGAFTVFALKSFFVAYAILSQSVEHEALELFDAVGDLATIILIVIPMFVPFKREADGTGTQQA